MRVPQGRILVAGLGASGRAAADFLLDLAGDREIVAADSAASEELERTAAELRIRGVEVLLGAQELGSEWDMIVASPGIPPHSSLLASAAAGGAPVVSEVELAWEYSDARFVAVTGTNGKTTTTSLLAHILCEAGYEAQAIGNIGTAAVSVTPAMAKESVMVVETSSFQLCHTVDFHPEISVILNITEDHIDWHGSFEAYRKAKARIFQNQGERDVVVIDIDDSGSASLSEMAEMTAARVVRVSAGYPPPGGAGVAEGVLVVETLDGRVGLCGADELQILGAHNVRNALAASAAALALGAEPHSVADGLRGFAPLHHRLEPVGVFGGVEYVDDSKATNPDSTRAALSAFEDRSLIALLGGRNKGNSFAGLFDGMPWVKRVIAFGEAGDVIASEVGDAVPVTRVASMREAIPLAREIAAAGDVVVLTPACASFDEFDGYAARGREFQRLVRQLAAEDGGSHG